MVLTSPPTPLASSTRLLQQLDEQLQQSNKDSDTAGDQSEGQVYEWDDYNVGINQMNYYFQSFFF